MLGPSGEDFHKYMPIEAMCSQKWVPLNTGFVCLYFAFGSDLPLARGSLGSDFNLCLPPKERGANRGQGFL